jgi:hypothetical protein
MNQRRTPGQLTCMRPTGTSWPQTAPLRFTEFFKDNEEQRVWRDIARSCLDAVIHIDVFPSCQQDDGCPLLSRQHHNRATRLPLPALGFPFFARFSAISCIQRRSPRPRTKFIPPHHRPLASPVPNFDSRSPLPTQLLSRQDTLRTRLFFRKEEERPPSRSRICVMSFCRAAE